jgi:hypothetical protein
MNMQFLLDMTNGTIFKVMADVTDGLLSKRMDIIVQQGKYHAPAHLREICGWTPKVSSIFFSRATDLANSAEKSSVDLFEYCQSTVSDAMVVLLLGKVGMPDTPIYENHDLTYH